MELSNRVQIQSLRGLNELDSRSFEIFEKVRVNPSLVLSQEEEAHLAEKQLLGLFTQWKDTGAWVRKLNQEFALWGRSKLSPERTS